MEGRGARRRATLIGALAVLLWATLALLTDATGRVPPFQLTAMTFGLGAGYQFNKYVALEGAYAYMGSVNVAGPGVDTETKTEGFDLLGVFTIPLTDRFSLLGKAGAYRMRATTEDPLNGINTGETSAGFAYGVGVGYDLGKLGIRGEFLRYDNVGGARVGEDSLFFLNVGVLFRFF